MSHPTKSVGFFGHFGLLVGRIRKTRARSRRSFWRFKFLVEMNNNRRLNNEDDSRTTQQHRKEIKKLRRDLGAWRGGPPGFHGTAVVNDLAMARPDEPNRFDGSDSTGERRAGGTEPMVLGRARRSRAATGVCGTVYS